MDERVCGEGAGQGLYKLGFCSAFVRLLVELERWGEIELRRSRAEDSCGHAEMAGGWL
jgi:hypothetical protein